MLILKQRCWQYSVNSHIQDGLGTQPVIPYPRGEAAIDVITCPAIPKFLNDEVLICQLHYMLSWRKLQILQVLSQVQ